MTELSVELLWAKNHVFAPGETQFAAEVPVFALWLMLEGRAHIESDGQKWTLEAGQMWLGAPTKNRRICVPETVSKSVPEFVSQGACWLSLGWQAWGLGRREVLRLLAPRIWNIEPDEATKLRILLELLVGDWDVRNKRAGPMGDGLARAIVGWLEGLAGPNWGAEPVPEWLEATLAAWEHSPVWGVEDLARAAHFSPAQFRRLFRQHLGAAPRDWITRRRLELARDFLLRHDETVADVAWRAGFGGQAQLSREFRRVFGLSPQQFRRLQQEKPV